MRRAAVVLISGALADVAGCAWTLRDPRAVADVGGEQAPDADASALDVAEVSSDARSDAGIDREEGPLDAEPADASDISDGSGDVAVDDARRDGGDADAVDPRDVADVPGDVDVLEAGDARAMDDVGDAASCPAAATRCGDACVDLETSTENCGACGAACGCGALCTARRCAPGTPVLWHPFDSNAVDLSARHNHGVVTGAGVTADRLGRNGGALRFGGAHSVRSAGAALPTGSAPRALSAWFRTAMHTSTVGTVAGWGGPDLNQAFELIVRGGQVNGSLGDFDLRAARLNVSDDRWHHAVLSHDGVAVTVYVDGVRDGSAARPLATVATDLFVGRRPIGARPVADDFFEGAIDDVRVYDRPLDAAAVRDLYRGCDPASTAPVVFVSSRDGNREIYVMHADGGGRRRLTSDPAEDTSPRWSRDGRRIAFVTRRFGGITVATMAADGSAVTRVATCGGDECLGLSWSPDDRWIYYHQRGSCTRSIMRAPSDGGGAPELAFGPTDSFSEWADVSPDGLSLALSFKPSCRSGDVDIAVVSAPFAMASPQRWPMEPVSTDDSHPHWSPDGERIVWTRGQDDLNVCVARRAEPIVCPIRTTANEFNPAWSPDGAQILFARRQGDTELFVAGADGSGERQLTDDASDDEIPDWRARPFAWVSPIAFQSDRDGNREIYVMNPDGSGQRRLTDNPGYDVHPVWSHAGTRIAFDSARPEGTGVYVMNADGRDARFVASGGSARAWSGDDQWVYFIRTSACMQSLHRVRLSDGVTEAVSMDGGAIEEADLSVDGGEVVFSRRSGCAYPELEIYRGALSSLRMPYTRVFADPDGSYDDQPRWSPDARRIAWTHASRSGGTYGRDNEIYVMNADGTGVQRLTNNTSEEWSPAWSPDGRELVFQSNRDGDQEIFIMNADGTNVRQLTSNGAADSAPHWRIAVP